MGVKGLCPAVVMGLVLGPMVASLTASLGTAQSVAVREESAMGTRHALITLSVREAPLANVLRDIAAQANLTVAFPMKVSQSQVKVTVDVREMPLDQVLAKVLEGNGFKATIVSGAIVFSEDVKAASTPVAQGGISGKVVDGKTRQGLRGATITLVGTNKGTTSRDDGSFRIADIAPGSYTVQVRLLGFIKTTKTMAVSEGQTAFVEFVLEPSVNALDQVVVTGTVVSTELRAVPNAITVITAKELEQRGITKIDQLFRGDVPGLFAQNTGASRALDEVTMFSRGATALSNASAGTGFNTNPIKTYVDGVELADPQYLSQIDPKSIERIEIVAGPQASTIYGSNAINGVMQVFTKRGTTGTASRPRLTATLLSGWVENNFSSARTPQHDDAAQVDGTEGHWAYNAGGSWIYMGPWSPGKQTARLSGFGGARLQRRTPLGPVTADGSLRLATTQTRVQGDFGQVNTAYQQSGWYAPKYDRGLTPPTIRTLVGQTLGLSLGVAPTAWWSHELVLGDDRSATESRQATSAYQSPVGGDTMLTLSQTMVDRRSLRYASTVQVPVAQMARLVATVGADGWQSLSTALTVNAPALTGTLTSISTPTVKRQPGHNTGGFVQAQVGFWDQLFVTYGLRAEWNPTYGEEAQPNWALRYGISYTRDLETPFGPLTAKLRASYGRSTRPPAAGAKGGQTATEFYGASLANTYLIPYYGNYTVVGANPELGPEHQRGGEGGIELYFGHHGSLVVTRYNQTVAELIAQPRVDSVRTLAPAIPHPLFATSCDADDYCYYSAFQNVNLGNIRNQGWELQGTVNVGPFTTRGTYSWTKGRVIGVNPEYRAFFTPTSYPQYQPGATFSFLPEHTWGARVTYTQARSMVALNFSGTGQLVNSLNAQFEDLLTPSIRLSSNRARVVSGSYTYFNAGYVQADLNASVRFSSGVDGILQIQNLGDVYHNDQSAVDAVLGRQTKLGIRLRL